VTCWRFIFPSVVNLASLHQISALTTSAWPFLRRSESSVGFLSWSEPGQDFRHEVPKGRHKAFYIKLSLYIHIDKERALWNKTFKGTTFYANNFIVNL
jgi:hypothetical protein